MAMVPIAIVIIFSLFQFAQLTTSKELIVRVPQNVKLNCNSSDQLRHLNLSLELESHREVHISENCSRVCNATLDGKIEDFCGIWQKVGLGAVLMLIILPVVFLSIYIHIKRTRDDRLLGDALRVLPGMPREFRFVELSKATGQFADENKLGEGSYGTVYKGVLPETGEIAVKKFSRETGHADFLAELTAINRLRHRNLVSLLGWCYKNKKLLLVYVYKSNGSLDKHLYSLPLHEILSWERRYNIILGLASSLHYLHNEYDQKVIHRDIKSSNIMLDSSFNSCLGDFGLARAINDEQTSYEEQYGVPGTWGYIAPECLHSGKATGRSDVFSFGAVVLEVVCGRRPGVAIDGFRFLVDWVWTMYEKEKLLEAVDFRLEDNYEAREAERLLLLGLACSHPKASERPKTQTIVQIISKSMPPPFVPLQKPAFVLPRIMEKEVTPGASSRTMRTEEDLYPPTKSFKCDTEIRDQKDGEHSGAAEDPEAKP